jgi:hypothetical protein
MTYDNLHAARVAGFLFLLRSGHKDTSRFANKKQKSVTRMMVTPADHASVCLLFSYLDIKIIVGLLSAVGKRVGPVIKSPWFKRGIGQ